MMYPIVLRICAALLTCSALLAQAETDPSTAQQIDQLNSRIVRLEEQLAEHQNNLTSLIRNRLQENLSFNGFASFGLSRSSGADGYNYYHGQSQEASVLPNTWLGLRMDARLYSSADVIVQLVGMGNDADDSLELKTEWLFLKQQLGHGFSAHIGRIRFPVHLDSEVFYIGNLYPTIAPAAEIYSVLSINHLDGLSINHALPMGSWTLDSRLVLWGQAKDLRNGHDISLKDMQGFAISLNHDDLTLRLGLFTGKKVIDIDEPANAELAAPLKLTFSDRLNYLSSAIRFDNQKFHLTAEGLAIYSRNNMMDEVHNWHVLAGFYIGPVLLYTGYARQHVSNLKELTDAQDKQLPAVDIVTYGYVPAGQVFSTSFNRQQRNLQLGVKYDLNKHAVLKAQVQYLHDFEGTRGIFATQDRTAAFDHAYLYDIAIQAFF